MTDMKCGRGHTLKAPFFYFPDVLWIGLNSPELEANRLKYANWVALDERGQLKQDAHFFCPECMLELLMVMERWRTGDPQLRELVKTWKAEQA